MLTDTNCDLKYVFVNVEINLNAVEVLFIVSK